MTLLPLLFLYSTTSYLPLPLFRMFLPLLLLIFGAKAQEFVKFHSVYLGQGALKGRVWKFEDRQAQIFRGIPYAEPPIGDLRFEKPVSKQMWRGERMALEDGAPCLQFALFYSKDRYSAENMKEQSEDCLYLNVFAPYDSEDTRRYPVMVWIHGGSFLAGSGTTSIDREVTVKNLVFKNVVVVTLNYRLGASGFLSYKTAEGGLKGNWGLYDIHQALQWIHKEIHNFQGDPTSVTLFGESAGAAAVSLLALSPMTEGLLHKAIIMSGSAAAGWAVSRAEIPRWEAGNVVKYLQCQKLFTADDMKDLLEEHALTASPHCNLVAEQLKCPEEPQTSHEFMSCLRNGLNFTDEYYTFRIALTHELSVAEPVVDGELIPYPVDVLLQNFTRIPIMIGNAVDEWGHKDAKQYEFDSYRQVNEEEMRNIVRRYTLEKIDSLYSGKKPNTTLDLLSNATYFHYITSNSQNASWDTMSLIKQMQTLEADADFYAPTVQEADAYAANNIPVYVYSFQHLPAEHIYQEEQKVFDFFGNKHVVKYRKRIPFEKAFHGLDHAYLFTEGYALGYDFQYSKGDHGFAKQFARFFTNFAKHGDPTPKRREDLAFVWEAYTVERPQFARLMTASEMSQGKPNEPSVSLWNEMVPFLKDFAKVNDLTAGRYSPLTDDERLQLNAYRRAWWALWLLVAVIALLLWTVVICLVAKKCMSPRTKNFNHVIISNNR